MNAKNILKLCEAEELTLDEFNKLLTSYFIKKMKSIDVVVRRGVFGVEGTYRVGSGSDSNFLEKKVKKYGKELSKTIKNFNLYSDYCFVPHSGFWIDVDSLFLFRDYKPLAVIQISCRLIKSTVFNVEICVRLSGYQNIPRSYLFPYSEDELKNYYSIIDGVVNAIRLVPFESE